MPPLPPLKPTSTFDGSVTACVRTATLSIDTVIVPADIETCTWCVAGRSAGTFFVVTTPLGAPRFERPTKFVGVPGWYVTRATAHPGMPVKPRPEPLVPIELGVAPAPG